MKTLILLILVVVLLEDVHSYRYRGYPYTKVKPQSYTPYSVDFEVICPEKSRIYSIRSNFSTSRHDRMWKFFCTQASTHGCLFHPMPTGYWRKLLFYCPNKGAITGLRSRFHTKVPDRVYEFMCCNLQGAKPARCVWTCIKNKNLGDLLFTTKPGWYINGMESVYNRANMDREWKFYMCLKKPPC